MLVTENELRKIIAESVKEILMTEDMQTTRNNAYQKAMNAYQNMPSFENLTSDSPYYGNKDAYQQQLDKKKRAMDKAARRNGLQFQQDLQKANETIATQNTQIENQNAQITSFRNALNQIKTQLAALLPVNESIDGSVPGYSMPGYTARNTNQQSAASQPVTHEPSELEAILGQINAVKEKITSLNGTISTQKRRIATLNQTIQGLNAQLAQAKNQAAAQTQDLGPKGNAYNNTELGQR